MMTDPISDMLTRIRNALSARKGELTLPYSELKYSVAKILEKEGYVNAVEKVMQGKFPALKIVLGYDARLPRIRSLKRVSKPGCRVYAKRDELSSIVGRFGIAVVSTPSGVMTSKEAYARRLGGEILCQVF